MADDNQDGYLKQFAAKWHHLLDDAKSLESPPLTAPDELGLISKFLFGMDKTLRKCRMCNKEYTGAREICDDPNCLKALHHLKEYNREYVWRRGIDYVATGPRCLVIDSLPEQTEQLTGMKQFDHLPPTIAEPDGYQDASKNRK
jgi:hypothetical protein